MDSVVGSAVGCVWCTSESAISILIDGMVMAAVFVVGSSVLCSTVVSTEVTSV